MGQIFPVGFVEDYPLPYFPYRPAISINEFVEMMILRKKRKRSSDETRVYPPCFNHSIDKKAPLFPTC